MNKKNEKRIIKEVKQGENMINKDDLTIVLTSAIFCQRMFSSVSENLGHLIKFFAEEERKLFGEILEIFFGKKELQPELTRIQAFAKFFRNFYVFGRFVLFGVLLPTAGITKAAVAAILVISWGLTFLLEGNKSS